MEHDAYSLFESLMALVGDAFAPPIPAVKGGAPPKPSGVVLRCGRVHEQLLRTKVRKSAHRMPIFTLAASHGRSN
jgi:hypothetical protein